MKKLLKAMVCLICVAIFGARTATSAPQEAQGKIDQAAILALTEEIKESYIARDWDRFADNFTADAIWLPNDMPPLLGKPAWWTFIEPFWHSSRIVEMEVTTEEIVVSGDLAYERHSETQLIAPTSGEGETMAFHFKGIWILERQVEGEWKISRYIWNFSPAPE